MRRVFDVTCAAVGLVLLSPLLALIALAIKLNGGGGSIFYLQPRVGKNGREFYLVKFRSMVSGADRHGMLTLTDDTRVTPIGRFLRKYKLDELPQLINVLKCDMRLVGPRPEMQRYVEPVVLAVVMVANNLPQRPIYRTLTIGEHELLCAVVLIGY